MLVKLTLASVLALSAVFAYAEDEEVIEETTEEVVEAEAPVCEITVESTDAMQYSVSEIVASQSCESFKITLQHTGELDKTTMGHNIVIAKADDLEAVVGESVAAGSDADYLVAGDEKIVAATALIGSGEETSLEISGDKLKEIAESGDAYKFFCTFPGHSFVMNGDFKVE